MSSANVLTAGVGVVYVAVAYFHLRDERVGFALMFLGYALANAGIIWAARG